MPLGHLMCVLPNFSKFGISLPELDNDYMLIIQSQNTYTYFFDTQAHTISTFLIYCPILDVG
jgi:hypothetical protein